MYLFALALTGCSAIPSEKAPDTGMVVDSAPPDTDTDTGTVDTGVDDTGVVDTDTSATDTSVVDTGVVDTDTAVGSDTADTDTAVADTAGIVDHYLTLDTYTELIVEGTETEYVSGNLTIEAWIRVPIGAVNRGQVLFGKHICTVRSGWWLGLVGNRLAFYEGTYFTAPSAMNDDTWHHVAGTFDGALGILYIDGVEVTRGAFGASATNASPWYAGDGCGTGYGAQADIDDIALWSTTRTAAEIATDAVTSLAGTEVGLELYLPFDEGSGQTTMDVTSAGWTAVLGDTTAVESVDAVWGP